MVVIVSNAFQGTLFDCVSECLEPVMVGAKSVPRYSVRLVRNESQPYQAIKISGSDQAIQCCLQIVRECLDNATKEKFLVVGLDSQNVAIGYQVITEGILDSSLVHPREVFQHAILTNAARLLLCHNHPSGDLTPSREDRAVTDRLKDCGKMMGIEVLDHIIVGNDPMTGDFRGVSMAATCGLVETMKNWD
jgi:DNA repair protein RadC